MKRKRARATYNEPQDSGTHLMYGLALHGLNKALEAFGVNFRSDRVKDFLKISSSRVRVTARYGEKVA